jgi:RNA polymerase sigma-70 factor (ECF subfamily)
MAPIEDSTQTGRLIIKAAQGSEQALEDLLDRHRAYLWRLVDLRLDPALRARIDPSDVVQETQIATAKRFSEFAQGRPCSFRVWLRKHAMQQMIDYRRHHFAKKRTMKREIAISDVSSMAIAKKLLQGTPSKIVQKRELQAQVRAAIETMKEVDREVILLRYVEDLSNAEISEILNISTDAVSRRHGRAIQRLCQQLTALRSDD